MSDDAEQQAEEIEVLQSIYEGDENFKQCNPTTYQYKYTEGDKSFILEISWGPTYPSEKPNLNLDIFYNQHLVLGHCGLCYMFKDMLQTISSACKGNGEMFLTCFGGNVRTPVIEGLPTVKDKILSVVNEEAEQWIGCAMTYTLFECLKEKVSNILAEQTEEEVTARVEKIVIEEQTESSKKPEKKEQLTKAQKRRAWDRAEIGRGGEKPRGWDWVDIVKHLSQAPHQPS